MRGVGIKDIWPLAFGGLSQLKHLYMSWNEITYIFDGLFSALANLETLEISFNKLKNLNRNSLMGLNSLQVLILSHNRIMEFDVNFLYTTKKIQLDVSFNNLTKFHIKNFTGSFQKLNLSHNEISEFSGSLSMLEIVKLDHNKLSTIDNITCNDNSSVISELNLSHNFLTDLPNASFFHSLHTLQFLYLDSNNLSNLQTDIFGKLQSLKSLNLSNNHFKEFQHGIFEHVENLEFLDLSRNNFTIMKRYFHTLSKLKELYLSDNHIQFLDSSQMIVDLPSLKQISVDGNRLSCDNLINIVQDFKKINASVSRGVVESFSNVHGIACNETRLDFEMITPLNNIYCYNVADIAS